MEKKMNIYSDEWCELVFAGKNHEYGAFSLRKLAAGRQAKSMMVACAFFTLTVCSPLIFNKSKTGQKDVTVDVNVISKFKPETVKKDVPKITGNTPPRKVNSIKFVPPVITTGEVNESNEMKTQLELSNPNKKIGSEDIIGADYVPGMDTAKVNPNRDIAGDDLGPVMRVPEQNPVFPGGYEEMMNFLKDNIRYPAPARQIGIEGTVYLSFIVSKTGKIVDVEILRGIDQSCDAEALRVLKMMPDWLPGKQNGMPVSVAFTLPVTFQLNN